MRPITYGPPAHPRSRGENEINKAAREHAAGSSPLTRGKPQQAALAVHALRLIPAHAGKTSSPTAHATRSTAHPRSRGENQAYFPIQDTNAGSSPLTRGKRVILRAAALVTRLIPAHAGKTLFDVSTGKQRRAHPRSRGENTCQAGLPQNSRGSSPLTRGKLHARDQGPCHPGLIPAHAGKTPRRPPTRPPPAAHPRSRGENLHLVGTRLEDGGSSPLTRGKHRPLTASKPMQRLIPAHAGKTDVHVGSGWWHGAHPRSRGENSRSSLTSSPGRGSSPLTRGKPSTPDAPRVRVGLIPAHAGKTRAARVAGRRSWAHPRSRGENAANIYCEKAEDGSSPNTRGKRAGRAPRSTASGLIPAHAGKTRWTVRRGGCRRAHPRSRGENRRGRFLLGSRSGSSPLTRGKLCGRLMWLWWSGLIPAHAGKTFPQYVARRGRAAHPRSRGENRSDALHKLTTWGSSPLTRGKLGQLHGRDENARLIPAHAGKTARW